MTWPFGTLATAKNNAMLAAPTATTDARKADNNTSSGLMGRVGLQAILSAVAAYFFVIGRYNPGR
jgi:hypothetical protein